MGTRVARFTCTFSCACARVVRVNQPLGLVLGFGLVCAPLGKNTVGSFFCSYPLLLTVRRGRCHRESDISFGSSLKIEHFKDGVLYFVIQKRNALGAGNTSSLKRRKRYQ